MRTLILYHSRTGHTRQVAELLAQQMDADIGEIQCPGYAGGLGGFAMAFDILTRHLPRIALTTDPGPGYDLVVVGGPVWAARAAPPVLRLLTDYGRQFPQVGLFVTCSGTSPKYPPEQAMKEMARAVPGKVLATAIFRDAAITSGAWRNDARGFAAALKTAHREMLPMDGAHLEL